MNKLQILILSAMLFVLGSCGIYNKYKAVEEVPEGLYGEEVLVTDDTTNIANLSWREIFTDPYLQRLIDSALVRNTDMLTAQLRVQEAEASLLSARLAYVPSFYLAPEGSISGTKSGIQSKTYTLPLTASWEFDLFGKNTNAKRQAQAVLEQNLAYEQAVKTQLVASVANLYYTLLMLDAQYEITMTTETAWSKSVDVTRAMKAAGLVNEAALAQTEATFYSIKTTALDLKEQINQVENSLCLLLATVPTAVERGTLEGQQFPEQLAVGIPLQMLSNRPDVRQAEWALAQAFYATNAARAAFYPSITLGGSIGWTNSIGNVIVNPAQFIFSATASITEPLFNRASNLTGLRIAKAQQEEARLAFNQTLLNAGVEVNEALEQYQTAKAKSQYYDLQVESLQTAARSTSLLMKHGSTTYLEVLTAQQTLLTAQMTQVSNRVTEIQAIITLYQALGGGRM